MGRKTWMLVVALVTGGCDVWGEMPSDGYVTLEEPLWDDDVVAASDGLYVRLPRAGSLVRLSTDGTVTDVDLQGAEPVSMELAPDGQTVLVFDTWPVCDTDEEGVETEADCEEAGGEIVWHDGLALVRDGAMVHEEEVPAHFNRLAFSPYVSGSPSVAVAYLDYTGEEIDASGVVNLTEVLFVDLETGEMQSLSVGFSASNVLFTSDGSRAVVLSRSQVVVVDLGAEPYETTVTFHLTLDADQEVDALGAALSPDDQYLMMSVVGSADLYVMDLVGEAINIVDLAGAPSAMAVDETADRTVLVYGNRAAADLVDHEVFDVETLELDEPCTALVEAGGGVVVAYNDASSTHDVYRLDAVEGEVEEYRVPNPVVDLQVVPDGTFGVAVQRPEATGTGTDLDRYFDEHWGMTVLDLTGGGQVDLVLTAEPVGLAFTEGSSGTPYALLLLSGLDELVEVDLWTAESTTVELPAPPTGLGATADGRFWITHDRALGLVSFLDPETGEMTEVSGFADEGLFTDDTLPRTDAGAEE